MLWYLIVPSSRAVQQGYWTIQCTICCLCINIALYPKTEIQKALSHGENIFEVIFLCSFRMKTSLCCTTRILDHTKQCTMCCLGSTMALQYFGYSRKNTFLWENNIFEAIFPMFFQEENLKTCFAFHFPTLERFFLVYSKSAKMTRKSRFP